MVSQRQIITRQIQDVSELKRALELVHNNYVRCGYMKPNAARIRLGVHYALPSTRTYIALVDEEIVATISFFLDSPLGLPLDSLYLDQANLLRSQNRKIAEVGMLADRREELSRGLHVLLPMMKLVFHASRETRMDDLLITVNPKHVAFYERLLCFEKIGPTRDYKAVSNAPAVLLRVNVSAITPADIPNERIRDLFFSPLEPSDTPSYNMRCEDIAPLFGEMTDIFRDLDREQIAAIEEQLPSLKISDLLRTAQERAFASSDGKV
jgi:hypothetical protein